VKKLTKNDWRLLGIFNPWEMCKFGGGAIYISYRAADYGRGGHGGPAWAVHGVNVTPDKEGHWANHGSKIFDTSRERRVEDLERAMIWCRGKFGIEDWEKDCFGSYQKKGTMERARSAKEKKV